MKSRSLLLRKRQADAVVCMLNGDATRNILCQDRESRMVGPRVEPMERSSFQEGDRVTVQRGRDLLVTGSIDTIASDGTLFCVLDAEGRGRFAVHVAEDGFILDAPPTDTYA